MSCQQCGSTRIANIAVNASDCHFVTLGEQEHIGYLPRDLGVGGGDYVKMKYCLDCGQIQGKWPLPPTELETK